MTERRPSERYLHLIGSITAYWSITEYLCDQAVAVLLGIETGRSRHLNSAAKDFGFRLEAIKALSGESLNDAQVRDELQVVLAKLAAASKARDRVVHSIWFNLGYEDLAPARYRFKSDKTPIVESSKHSLEELKQVFEEIKDATEDLTAFLIRRLGAPPAMPGLVIETVRE